MQQLGAQKGMGKLTKNIKLIQLNKDEVTALYHERMVNDFIEDELKPLWAIHKAMDAGTYEALGLTDEDMIIGYVFLVRQGRNYLVDYFATYPDQRNKGLGAEILKLLGGYLSDADVIIGEVEDPAFAENEEQRNLQNRRIGFYKRNGCSDTGLRVKCFGVPFIVMQTKESGSMDRDALWETYQSFYRAVLPKAMFDKNIEYLDFIDNAEIEV